MKDHEFLAEAERLQLEVTPMSGIDLQKLVGELAGTSPEIVDRLRAMLTSSSGR